MTHRLFCLLALTFCSTTALAAGVYRCVDGNGNAAFLDQPCDSMALRDQQAESEPTATVTRSNAGFCPAPDLESLKLAINDAFARRDVNALAGLYHWPSVGRGGSGPIMRYLESLLERRLIAIEPRFRPRHRITAYGISREVSSEDEDAIGLQLVLGTDPPGPTDTANLSLARNAGCLWISEAYR